MAFRELCLHCVTAKLVLFFMHALQRSKLHSYAYMLSSRQAHIQQSLTHTVLSTHSLLQRFFEAGQYLDQVDDGQYVDALPKDAWVSATASFMLQLCVCLFDWLFVAHVVRS